MLSFALSPEGEQEKGLEQSLQEDQGALKGVPRQSPGDGQPVNSTQAEASSGKTKVRIKFGGIPM